MNASWPQTKTIWSIIIKVKEAGYTGPASEPQFWKKLSDEGRLDRTQASGIISSFIEKDMKTFENRVNFYDSTFLVDAARFKAARRWKPKSTYPPGVPPQEEPDPEFNIDDRVEHNGQGDYSWLKGCLGTVKGFQDGSATDVGILWDKMPEDHRGHDLGGRLVGDENERGWWVNRNHLIILSAPKPEAEEKKEYEPWEEEPADGVKQILKDGEPEDEFTKKLRELELAHKKSKEEAAKRKALEKFDPQSIEYIKPAIFDDVCAMIKGGVQVCLVGPSGCGKSLLVNEVAKVLKKDLYMESFAGGKRYSQVFGSTHLVDGKSEWVAAKFLLELQKENNLVFMDEVMSADPDVLIGANPILDRKTRCFHSPVGVISVNPRCIICAASNVTGREYSMNYKGTQQQDASVLNRFVHIHMTYDDKVEKTILKKSPLDEADKLFLDTTLKNLRKAVSTHNISYDPSTRKLVQAIELVALGLPAKKAFEYSFLTPLSEVERKKIGL